MRHVFSLSHGTHPDAMARRLMERAHHRDGLPEILVGLTFLVTAGLIAAQWMLPAGSIGSKAAALSLALFVPALCFGAPRILKGVRTRYLLDRVGYVRHKRAGGKGKVAAAALGGLMALTLFWAVTGLSHPDPWILAGTGLFGGGLVVFCGRLPRFVAGGVLVAMLGAGLAISGISLPSGFAILFGVQGVVLLVSGGIQFLRFLHQ